MFNKIISFVKNIVSFVKNLLPWGKKSEGFFLEIDDDQSSTDVNNEAVVVTGSAPKTKLDSKGQEEPINSQATSVASTAKVYRAVDNVEQLIINAVYQKNSNQSETDENTFANNYLIPKPNPNRRPGASLNKFREMARSVSLPKSKSNAA
ncbi:hypothetical protein Xen7305DRAFT_00025030 [Xenococcus sp. PCC 7305]|uniref:hypothetical protein n=1 Tax=Xenococcus sp. PCC 7305 TaxID=102125 RepID=UPI0002AC82FD|nr:hypothetical protein [Xenococcus sp. PCC 7305]ELS02785.1 hypothetical protein Xen7305DRAFT_00025030 [Xenococcus sp. PCC 7305]